MKILIAEDQPTAALLLRHNLEKMGHEAIVAPDGEVAWRIVREGDTPLLISDWIMPHLDGPELCRRIRATKSNRYTYIILLTSRDRQEDKLEGLRTARMTFSSSRPIRRNWLSGSRSRNASWPSTNGWPRRTSDSSRWPRPTSSRG